METISVYLAGNIQKDHDKESGIFWTLDDIDQIKKAVLPNEVIFLNPASRTDDLSDQLSVFGRDMSQVYFSDITLVDVRERRGLGVGAEMMWAKANQRHVITLCPKNSHYHRDPCVLLGQTVPNWTHPFVESLSDVIVEDIDEMGQAVLNFIKNNPVSKDLQFMHQAMEYYQENQLEKDVPMKELIDKHSLLKNRFLSFSN